MVSLHLLVLMHFVLWLCCCFVGCGGIVVNVVVLVVFADDKCFRVLNVVFLFCLWKWNHILCFCFRLLAFRCDVQKDLHRRVLLRQIVKSMVSVLIITSVSQHVSSCDGFVTFW